MRKDPDSRRDHDDELTTEIPGVPHRDLGTGGTKDIDRPRNADDVTVEPVVPEPPD